MDLSSFTQPSGRLVDTSINLVPYRAFLPDPLPPDISINWELSSRISAADRALAELAGIGHRLKNPTLLLVPFVRREAVLSSKIEGTRTLFSQLVAYETTKKIIPGLGPSTPSEEDVLEVYNYVKTMELGVDLIKTQPVDLALIRKLHARLLEGVRSETGRLGYFRDHQNFIGQQRDPDQARFIPPPVEDLDGLLKNFESYISSGNRYPPLIRLAIIHYQFETIHPFMDGNGRIGRLIIPLLMIKWNLLPSPLLYLSGFLEQHRQDYYDKLMAVRQRSAWQEWIDFFLKGVEVQAQDAFKRSIKLDTLYQTWFDQAVARDMPANVMKLIVLLFENPFLTIPRVQALLGNVTYPTARSNVDKLVDMKIIEPFGEGRYDKKYIASKVFEIIS